MAGSTTESPGLTNDEGPNEMIAWQAEMDRRTHLMALTRSRAEEQGTKATWRLFYNWEYEVRAWEAKRPQRDPGYEQVVRNAAVAHPIFPPESTGTTR